MQYNFFNIEILGEEKLKGVGIPVVIDSTSSLTDEQMQSTAKLFNAYRTVFIRSSISDNLDMRVFSATKEMFDCFYAEVAAVYSLTKSSFIREIEKGKKQITINDPENSSQVSISYESMKATGLSHKVKLPDVTIAQVEKTPEAEEIFIETKDKKFSSKLVYVEDPLEFSKRRKLLSSGNIKEDKLLVHYDSNFKNVFFYVSRMKNSKDKIDSRHQLGFIVKVLLEKGIDRKDIKNICHLLNLGQYSIMETKIDQGEFFVKMNARTFAEGILNI